MHFRRSKSRKDGSLVQAILHKNEAEILAWIPTQIRRLFLDPEASKPYIDRLFPPASRSDTSVADEYRKLLGRSLFEERREILDRFETTLKKRPLVLDAGEADLWLHVINDFRLVLGVRLNVDDESYWEKGPDNPEDLPSFELMQWLGHVQGALIDALDSPST